MSRCCDPGFWPPGSGISGLSHDGHNPGMADATVAGIAKAHDLAVVTRNGKHFQLFDIAVLSPEEAARTA